MPSDEIVVADALEHLARLIRGLAERVVDRERTLVVGERLGVVAGVVVDRAERRERERDIGVARAELLRQQLDRARSERARLVVVARAIEHGRELADLIGDAIRLLRLGERERGAKLGDRRVALAFFEQRDAGGVVPVDELLRRIAGALGRDARDLRPSSRPPRTAARRSRT